MEVFFLSTFAIYVLLFFQKQQELPKINQYWQRQQILKSNISRVLRVFHVINFKMVFCIQIFPLSSTSRVYDFFVIQDTLDLEALSLKIKISLEIIFQLRMANDYYYHCKYHQNYQCRFENQCHPQVELFFVWYFSLLFHHRKHPG